MPRRRKFKEATAAREAAARAQADLAEQRKEDALARARAVVEFSAELDEDEAEAAAQALAAAGGSLPPNAIQAVAAVTGRSRSDTAHDLAAASANQKAYTDWLAANGLSTSDPTDPI